MLYFGYGSNLNHNQMKKKRCVGSVFVQTAYLKDHDLSFCHPNKNNVFGYANVFKKKGSKVPGAVWKISKKHEKILKLLTNWREVTLKDKLQRAQLRNTCPSERRSEDLELSIAKHLINHPTIYQHVLDLSTNFNEAKF